MYKFVPRNRRGGYYLPLRETDKIGENWLKIGKIPPQKFYTPCGCNGNQAIAQPPKVDWPDTNGGKALQKNRTKSKKFLATKESGTTG